MAIQAFVLQKKFNLISRRLKVKKMSSYSLVSHLEQFLVSTQRVLERPLRRVLLVPGDGAGPRGRLRLLPRGRRAQPPVHVSRRDERCVQHDDRGEQEPQLAPAHPALLLQPQAHTILPHFRLASSGLAFFSGLVHTGCVTRCSRQEALCCRGDSASVTWTETQRLRDVASSPWKRSVRQFGRDSRPQTQLVTKSSQTYVLWFSKVFFSNLDVIQSQKNKNFDVTMWYSHVLYLTQLKLPDSDAVTHPV